MPPLMRLMRVAVSRDFAIELESLTNLGLTMSDLRWLVIKGYLEQAYEVTGDGDAQRRFQPCRHLAFGKRTCFVFDRSMCLSAPRGLSLAKTSSDPLPSNGRYAARSRGKDSLFAVVG